MFLLAQFLAQERRRRKRTRAIELEVCQRTPPWTPRGVLVLTSSESMRTGAKGSGVGWGKRVLNIQLVCSCRPNQMRLERWFLVLAEDRVHSQQSQQPVTLAHKWLTHSTAGELPTSIHFRSLWWLAHKDTVKMSLLSLIWAYLQPPFHDFSFIVPKESGSFSRDSSALGWQLPSGFRAKPAYPFVSLSIHLIWGAAVLLLGLLVVAVVLFAVFARRKGMKLSTSSSGSVWKRRAGDRVCFPHEKSFR